jgi:hyperosmotically inducible periplasmic protein
MNFHGIAALAAAVALTVTTGCRREEPVIAPPPAPPAQTTPAPGAAAPATTDAGRTVGETIDDVTITGRVKAAFAGAPEVSAMDINVTTVNGVVQLSGFVSNQAHMDRAAQIARSVEGVRDVQNNLAVRP